MSISALRHLSALFVLLCATSAISHAQPAASGEDKAAPATAAPADSAGDFGDEPDSNDRHLRRFHNRSESRNRRGLSHQGDDLVNIGHDSVLESGERADAVVSVFGSSTSNGDALDVVSVFGNTRVTGPVAESAVAVLGDTYIDSKVDGDAVAVLGNVELGPHAEIGGEVVAVLGTVHRDAAAIVHGGVQNFSIGNSGTFQWLQSWIRHCLLYGRPLAFAPGLGWAWTLALGFLAFYVCVALLFRNGIERCVHTLETQPGHTALAALLAILLTPVLFVLLCVTLIGIAAVPFLVAALFCVSLFGKAVMLAWVGGRITSRRPGAAVHPAIAVLVGGGVVLLLYVVPVLGFLVYKLLGFFGFGAVVYTLILAARARRAANGGRAASPPPYTASATAASAAAAASMPGPHAAAGPYAAAEPGVAAASAAAAAAPAGAAAPGPAAVAPLPHISAAMPRAGFWIRMAALFLDVVMVAVVLSFVHPFGNVFFVLLATYGAVMWKLRGATVGGIVFDLHVVRLDARPVDWETAIVRALGCFLSLFIVFLGFIWIAFDSNRQAWHDKIAGTVVVQAKKALPI